MEDRAIPKAITANTTAFVHGDAGSSQVEPRTDTGWDHGANRASPILPLTVRRVRLLDVADLRSLDLLFRLNLPDSQLKSYSAFRAGARAAMPGMRGRRPAFVARAGDRLVGFIQFRPKEPDDRWVVLAVGTAVGVYESDPVIEAMLEHGVRSAGLRGVKRLFASVPKTYALSEAFRRQAWTPYATEWVFSGPSKRAHGGGAVRLRPQQQVDTWAIHQLYNAAVPKPVQDAEALTSHHWDLRAAAPPMGAREITGWLIEDGHLVIGYARITESSRACVVEFVYHPERIDILPDLVEGALDEIRPMSGRRNYCAVRGYQAELATALGDRGFDVMLEQDLMIKYTTATVRLPVIETVPFQLEVGEKIPQRVPTFLQGRSGDGAAS